MSLMAFMNCADTDEVNRGSRDVRRQIDQSTVQGRKSSFAASEITFGPVGRIVATVLVVGVVWWLNTAFGIFGLVLAIGYLRDFLPQALRDIWRPVRVPATEADVIRAKAEAMRLDEQPPTFPSRPSQSGGRRLAGDGTLPVTSRVGFDL